MSAEVEIGGSPVSSIIEGSARMFRFENNNTHFVTLALESFGSQSVHHISKIMRQMVNTPKGSNYEQEFVEVRGHLHTDRIVNASRLKQAITANLVPQYTTTVKLSEHRFKLNIAQIGHLETLRFEEEPVVELDPASGEVEIQVWAVSVDSFDHGKAMGRGQSQSIQFGNACAGKITKASQHGKFNVGVRVFCPRPNSFQSHLQAVESQVFRIPDEIDFAGACDWIPALTAAHYALAEIGRYHDGDSILIYPCAGFIGEAAIKVCQKLGAKMWTNVHGEEQGRMLCERFNLPATSVLSHDAFNRHYRPGFHGANVVLCTEPIGSHQSWDFVNKFGRIVYMPTITSASVSSPSLQPPTNASFTTLDFQETAAELPHLLQDSFNVAVEILLADGRVENRSSFGTPQVKEALEFVANTNDKAVITLDADMEIALTRNTQPMIKLDPNASYVICGGTGGIGRGMVRWCAMRGARNLILLSRSGAKTKEAQELVSSLTSQGLQVEAPSCDVADQACLKTVLDDCLRRMPPIKGWMQAGGAFKDLSFEMMTLNDWNTAIKSKVTASWNLHKVLPANLDFFVMTSSSGGILGMISQSSYAGSNTYEDALARHRIATGEKAAAFDLGILDDVGFVTDAQKDRLQRMGFFIPNYEAEIFALLDIFCDRSSPMLNSTECRPITGFKSAAQMAADGVDVPFTFTQPLWQHLLHAPVDDSRRFQAKTTEAHVRSLIESAETIDEATAIATSALMKRVTVLLSAPEERLQEGATMQSYGIDSLVAIELRNWLDKTFGADVAVFEIVGGASFVSIGKAIATQIRATD